MLEKEELVQLNKLTATIKDSKVKDDFVYTIKYEVKDAYISEDYISDYEDGGLSDVDVIEDLKEIFKVTNMNSYDWVNDTTLKFEFIRVEGWSKSNIDYDYEDYKSYFTIKSTTEGLEHIEELINNTFDTNTTHDSQWFSNED